jgi:hypothetical protein
VRTRCTELTFRSAKVRAINVAVTISVAGFQRGADGADVTLPDEEVGAASDAVKVEVC